MMKRMNVMITIILMAFLAGNSNLNAQRGMRGLMRDSLRISKADTTGMNWMRMHNGPMFDRYQMYGMGRMRNAPGWRGLSRPGPMGRWSDDFRPGPGRRGIYPMPPAPFHRGPDSTMMNRMGRFPVGRDSYMLNNIPGLTENQKTKLKELTEKNQSEMKKFREDIAASMEKMREQHREKILEVLNPEQKKWFESRVPD